MLSMFKSNSYASKFTPREYPIAVKLKDKLFFEVNLNTSNSDLGVYIQNCYATMTPNYADKRRYNIIKDRYIAVDI